MPSWICSVIFRWLPSRSSSILILHEIWTWSWLASNRVRSGLDHNQEVPLTVHKIDSFSQAFFQVFHIKDAIRPWSCSNPKSPLFSTLEIFLGFLQMDKGQDLSRPSSWDWAQDQPRWPQESPSVRQTFEIFGSFYKRRFPTVLGFQDFLQHASKMASPWGDTLKGATISSLVKGACFGWRANNNQFLSLCHFHHDATQFLWPSTPCERIPILLRRFFYFWGISLKIGEFFFH